MTDEKRFWNSHTATGGGAVRPTEDEERFWNVFTATGDPEAYLRYRAGKRKKAPPSLRTTGPDAPDNKTAAK